MKKIANTRSQPAPAARPPGTAGAAQGGARAPALWQLLQAAAQALQAVLEGRSSTQALAGVDVALRPGAQALLFDALRHLGAARAQVRLRVPRRPPPAVDALLLLCAALLRPGDSPAYAPHTLVSQAVEAAKRDVRMRAQAGLVNACLRRMLREPVDLATVPQGATDEVRWNHPGWWVERLQRDHPDAWQAILQANQVHAPMSLRVNLRHGSPAEYVERLAAVGLAGQAAGPCGVVLAQPVPVALLPGFAQGWVSVQDLASQQAAPLLLEGLLRPGQVLQVLDACAAPGGKTAHLLEYGGEAVAVTALEVDATRAARISETLDRLGLQARVCVADAGDPAHWPDDVPPQFDAILLDAPCTASGIVRRHPDVRWLRRPTDVAQLAAEQARLLGSLWPRVRPGGRLLYCTCSVFAAEGREQVAAFLANNTDATPLPSPGHLLPASAPRAGAVPDNRLGEHDGFFYALLAKRG